MHIIAAKAICFEEDLQPEFKAYCEQIIKNCKALAEGLKERGYKLITGGTDNHLLLVDVYSTKGKTGKEVEVLLDKVGITVNKNTIPGDTLPPMITSGIRLGTAAVTTRGFKEEDMKLVAKYIDEAINSQEKPEILEEIHQKVIELTSRFPLPYRSL
jgi:glycine hydroxymethyltransferase